MKNIKIILCENCGILLHKQIVVNKCPIAVPTCPVCHSNIHNFNEELIFEVKP